MGEEEKESQLTLVKCSGLEQLSRQMGMPVTKWEDRRLTKQSFSGVESG